MPFGVYQSVDPVGEGGADPDAKMSLLTVSPRYEQASNVDRAMFLARRQADEPRVKRLIAPMTAMEDFPTAATKEEVLQIVRDNRGLYPSEWRR